MLSKFNLTQFENGCAGGVCEVQASAQAKCEAVPIGARRDSGNRRNANISCNVEQPSLPVCVSLPYLREQLSGGTRGQTVRRD